MKVNIRRCLVAVLLMILFTDMKANNYRSEDLSSATQWTLQIDGKGKWRSIKVPYGGWNSDRQNVKLDENTDVKDFVVYRRMLNIPKSAADNVVKIHFGAVNFGAEVYIDGKLVTEHHSNFTAFDADITEYVTAGKSCKLEVKAYVLNHYKNKEGKYLMPTGYIYDSGLAKYPFGIARGIELRIFPKIYISDVFVKTSVSKLEMSYEATIVNATSKTRKLMLKSTLDSWNKSPFKYPEIDAKEVVVDANSEVTVRVNNIPWMLGRESYWWPNIPFNEDYIAQLHNLNLTISEGGKEWNAFTRRFGFVEHAEGPYYYTINGVRVNMASDATAITQGCVYDAYAESEAFKNYPELDKGCKNTWRKYMRLGIRANRTHQEPPTQKILDAADEVGFVIIPETAIRGSHWVLPQSYDPDNDYYRQHIGDMVRECRNHPSVARYSLSNEMHAIPELIDMGLPFDNTRPYVFETNTHANSTRVTSKLGHAYVMAHYVDYPKPAQGIFGLGEFAWATDGINEFATIGKKLRMNDVCYFSGWSWCNYWPNFLEGWSHDTYAWRQNNHPDRKDGVDGWNSPIINYVKKSLHPYLILDKETEMKNQFSDNWPDVVSYYSPDTVACRELYIFNDALDGEDVKFEWESRWDSPQGEIVQSGSENLDIKPGFYVRKNLEIAIPGLPANVEKRKLYLVMKSVKDGKVKFVEDHLWFCVGTSKPVSDIEYMGEDTTTQGDWMGKYGKEGYEIASSETKLPGYIKVSYEPADVFAWSNSTDDRRALQCFVNDGNVGVGRVAAAHTRYGNIHLTVDVGNETRQMAIYFMDWDRDYSMPVVLLDKGKELKVENFKSGKYLKFRVCGKVSLEIGDGRSSNISGIFFDKLD